MIEWRLAENMPGSCIQKASLSLLSLWGELLRDYSTYYLYNFNLDFAFMFGVKKS